MIAMLNEASSTWTATQLLAFVAFMGSMGVASAARPWLCLTLVASSAAWVHPPTAFGALPLVLLGSLWFGTLIEHIVRSSEWTEWFAGLFEVQGIIGLAAMWALCVFGAGDVPNLMTPPSFTHVSALVLAVVLNLLAVRLLRPFHHLVQQVGLSWLWHIGESAVALVIALLSIAAPLVTVALVGVGLTPLGIAVVGWQSRVRKVEAQQRHPCPACGALVRPEASRCPACHASLDIVRPLVAGPHLPIAESTLSRPSDVNVESTLIGG